VSHYTFIHHVNCIPVLSHSLHKPWLLLQINLEIAMGDRVVCVVFAEGLDILVSAKGVLQEDLF